ITGIKVNDIREKEMPNIGFVWMEDAESQKGMYVNTSDSEVRKQYTEYFLDHEKYFKNAFARSGAGVIQMFCHESYVKKLLAYFKERLYEYNKILYFTVSFIASPIWSQNAIKSQVDTTEIKIGEAIGFTIKAQVNADDQVDFPSDPLFGPFEVIDHQP